MPSQNDFSIKSSNTYRGNEQISVITGSGMEPFQTAALCTIESIIRNSGFSDYRMSTINGTGGGTTQNSRVFYDADNDGVGTNPPPQTTQPVVDILLSLMTGVSPHSNVDGTVVIAASPLDDLIQKIAPKAFSLYSKASKYLDTTSTVDECAEDDSSGRYQAQIDECIYKVCVSIF